MRVCACASRCVRTTERKRLRILILCVCDGTLACVCVCVFRSHHAQCHYERRYLKKMDVTECVALWLGYRDMTVCLSSEPVYCYFCIMILFRWIFFTVFPEALSCVLCPVSVSHSHTHNVSLCISGTFFYQ